MLSCKITILIAFLAASPGDSLPVPARSASDPWFSEDKFMHFGASLMITGFSCRTYTGGLGYDRTEGRVVSVSLTGLVGLGKEVYDLKKKGRFSWKDLLYDGLGIGAGWLLFSR